MDDGAYYKELRLFIEETCCDLCRFQHVSAEGAAHEHVRIRQEVDLGIPGAFADIEIRVRGAKPYFLEVKVGYPPAVIVDHVGRKYGTATPASAEAEKVIVVVKSVPKGLKRRCGSGSAPGWRSRFGMSKSSVN